MDLLLALALGLASSGLVGWIIYGRQRREGRAAQRELLAVIEEQAGHTKTLLSTMVVVGESHDRLVGELESLRSTVDGLTQTIRPLAAPPFARAARVVADQMEPKVLALAPKASALSVATLRRLHRLLFPVEYAPAGKLRTVQVWIRPTRGTPESASFKPPPPEQVTPQLGRLLEEWNAQYQQLSQAGTDAKLQEIARFHHRLVSLHPFLDGNGVIARLVTRMQLRDLLGHTGKLDIDRDVYIQALEAADREDLSPLVNLIGASLR